MNNTLNNNLTSELLYLSSKCLSGCEHIADYDKNGGQSSNVDSGRGSVAYSSGRRPEASLHDTSADSDALGLPRPQPQPGPSQQPTGQGKETKKLTLSPKCLNFSLLCFGSPPILRLGLCSFISYYYIYYIDSYKQCIFIE